MSELPYFHNPEPTHVYRVRDGRPGRVLGAVNASGHMRYVALIDNPGGDPEPGLYGPGELTRTLPTESGR
ncbi:hypothetical protein [Streptomyces sp. NBC_01304]|uniref:hypothetical protein n=1 Tax=Streptomyces sp. NBC_01304 TaxID=2903818 RepID=UPI002E0FD859|nr:hypothetical protein OG430_44550 [Streptomyces sp. NBC_01304]